VIFDVASIEQIKIGIIAAQVFIDVQIYSRQTTPDI